jgi:hypothetical protein
MASPLLAALRSPLRPSAPAGPAPSPTTTTALRGRTADPGWPRWCLLALLGGTAVLYLWDDGAAGHTWVAAAVGSEAAAGYQLASGAPVMALGGFNGTDPAPTLAQFRAYVAVGAVHFFVGDESSASISSTASGGSDNAARIAAWVASHYRATTVGGTTVYDFTTPAMAP